jgi:thiol-disulfide isomerase/thioredoxin
MTLHLRFLLATAFLALGVRAEQALLPLDEAGYQKMLAANKGKVVLVDFWATWCEPCRAEMPRVVKLEASLRARGFQLVTISADEPEQEAAARKLLAQTAVPGPWYVKKPKSDSAFIDAVDQRWSGALPAMYLYDRTGRKRQMFIGETASPAIEAAIRKLL